mgnify:CR=1 FL=1
MIEQRYKIVLEIHGKLGTSLDEQVDYLIETIASGSYVGLFNKDGEFKTGSKSGAVKCLEKDVETHLIPIGATVIGIKETAVQRYKIVLEINGKLDLFPGVMYELDDHIQYITHVIKETHGDTVKLLDGRVFGDDYHKRLIEATLTKENGSWKMKSDEEVKEFFAKENG